MERNGGAAMKTFGAAGGRLKIVKAATYVGRMTGTATEAKGWIVKGLHKAPVLAYGSSARCL